jgi:hypothetical protein
MPWVTLDATAEVDLDTSGTIRDMMNESTATVSEDGTTPSAYVNASVSSATLEGVRYRLMFVKATSSGPDRYYACSSVVRRAAMTAQVRSFNRMSCSKECWRLQRGRLAKGCIQKEQGPRSVYFRYQLSHYSSPSHQFSLRFFL